jgi:hypothetical protein
MEKRHGLLDGENHSLPFPPHGQGTMRAHPSCASSFPGPVRGLHSQPLIGCIAFSPVSCPPHIPLHFASSFAGLGWGRDANPVLRQGEHAILLCRMRYGRGSSWPEAMPEGVRRVSGAVPDRPRAGLGWPCRIFLALPLPVVGRAHRQSHLGPIFHGLANQNQGRTPCAASPAGN